MDEVEQEERRKQAVNKLLEMRGERTVEELERELKLDRLAEAHQAREEAKREQLERRTDIERGKWCKVVRAELARSTKPYPRKLVCPRCRKFVGLIQADGSVPQVEACLNGDCDTLSACPMTLLFPPDDSLAKTYKLGDFRSLTERQANALAKMDREE